MGVSDSFVFVLCMTAIFAVVTGECPIDESAYKSWTTEIGSVSQTQNVTITEKVVLDTSHPVELFSIHITSTGTLLFSNNCNINLRVHYILVDGSLIIGTEDCKHTANVLITLLGEENSYKVTGLDEKFIGVRENGTLELHGKEKLPWTRLTSTVHKVDYEHGLIFRHQDQEFPDKNNTKFALVAQVFNSAGNSVKNATVILKYNNNAQTKVDNAVNAFQTFLNGVTTGHVIALAIQKNIIKTENLTQLYNIVEGLMGTNELSKVPLNGAYAAVAVKGDSSQSVEEWTYDANEDINFAAAELIILSSNRKYQASSFVNRNNHGQSKVDFLSTNTDYSLPIINLDNVATSWEIGDTVVLTSTDYDWHQAEECHIIDCGGICTVKQVRLDCSPVYTHFGEFCPNLERLDMRGEVGILTRNIKIMGETNVTFGGHIKMLPKFKNAHIEGVELTQMGQNPAIGRYPIHFHMCQDVGADTYTNPAYVRSNSIHHTFARGTTIHGTFNLLYEYNFVYDTLGHAVFLEDGGEHGNVIQYNLVGGQRKTNLIPVDNQPASYWITNPKNYFRNNIAFGSDGAGFWGVFPREPIEVSFGLGFMERDEARHTAYYEFVNNTAHSCVKAGFFHDNELTENNTATGYNKYQPFVDPFDSDSGPDPVYFINITAYKNIQQNVWIRGGRITLQHCSLADSEKGLTLVRENKQHPSAEKCIIIGDSCNLGKPANGFHRSLPKTDTSTRRLGVVIQKGPNYVNETYFGNFEKTSLYDAGAIAVEYRTGGKLTTMHGFSDIKFGYDDSATTGKRVIAKNSAPDVNKDYLGTFRDHDGSVTTIPDSQVVQIRDFYLTDDCKQRSEWGFAACPNHYGFLRIDIGEDSMKIARDDDPTLVDQSVNPSEDPIFMVIVGGVYSYVLEYQSAAIPTTVRIKGEGVTKTDWIRVGICIPKDAQFELKGLNMPIPLGQHSMFTEVNTVAQVDADPNGSSFFFDRDVGVLFLKLVHKSDQEYDDFNNCPDNLCPNIRITFTAGNMTDRLCLSNAYHNDKYKKNIQVTQSTAYPTTIPASASSGPPENWGAGKFAPIPWP